MSKIVPWIDWDEFDAVFAGLFHSDKQTQCLALKRAYAWLSRCRVPSSISSTVSLVDAIYKIDSSSLQEKKNEELLCRLSLSSAIVRFVNLLLDPLQKSSRATSMNVLAQQLALPSLLVDVRHDSTHGQLPSLSFLRHAANLSLQWLRSHFWLPHKHYRDNISLEVGRLFPVIISACEKYTNVASSTRKERERTSRRQQERGESISFITSSSSSSATKQLDNECSGAEDYDEGDRLRDECVAVASQLADLFQGDLLSFARLVLPRLVSSQCMFSAKLIYQRQHIRKQQKEEVNEPATSGTAADARQSIHVRCCGYSLFFAQLAESLPQFSLFFLKSLIDLCHNVDTNDKLLFEDVCWWAEFAARDATTRRAGSVELFFALFEECQRSALGRSLASSLLSPSIGIGLRSQMEQLNRKRFLSLQRFLTKGKTTNKSSSESPLATATLAQSKKRKTRSSDDTWVEIYNASTLEIPLGHLPQSGQPVSASDLTLPAEIDDNFPYLKLIPERVIPDGYVPEIESNVGQQRRRMDEEEVVVAGVHQEVKKVKREASLETLKNKIELF